jgi:hypothetical protein
MMSRSVAHDVLYNNYQQRRTSYLSHRSDYRQKKDYVDKLAELAQDLLARAGATTTTATASATNSSDDNYDSIQVCCRIHIYLYTSASSHRHMCCLLQL